MNRVTLTFEYDAENKPMVESSLEPFVSSCIAYTFSEDTGDDMWKNYGEICEHCGKYETAVSENSCAGCPLE